MSDETDPSTHDTEQRFYRCKLCLNAPDKRISAAARFRLESAEDYAEVLRHGLQKHPDSSELAEIMDMEYATPCARCEDVFLTRMRLTGEGLSVRNFCDECAEDSVEKLIHRSVRIHEVLPVLSPAGCSVDTDTGQ